MTVVPFRSRADVTRCVPAVAAHLARGGLLAYPTETVYGLGSRLRSDDLAALAAITERPEGKPFLALIANKKMAEDCELRFNAAAGRLAHRFWPGPLTLVLAGEKAVLPEALRGVQGGFAVRWSSHSEISRLIECLGMPISSTSANVSGEEPALNVAGILAAFEEPVKSAKLLVLDGGTLERGPASTLVDCTSPEPTVLREGAISWRQIRECLDEAID